MRSKNQAQKEKSKLLSPGMDKPAVQLLAEPTKLANLRTGKPTGKYSSYPNATGDFAEKQSAQLDDDVLERIDFLACLLANRTVQE
jgi:hypothetical protein